MDYLFDLYLYYVIFSRKGNEEHLQHVKEVISRLQDDHIFVSPNIFSLMKEKT